MDDRNPCGDDPVFAGEPLARDTNLFIIRHAKVDTGGLMYGGDTDVEVDQGYLEEAVEPGWLVRTIAERVIMFPSMLEVYSSPMKRAMQTAEMIRLRSMECDYGVELDVVQPIPDLREQSFGRAEGMPFAEALATFGTSRDVPAPGNWSTLYNSTFVRAATNDFGAESAYAVLERQERFLKTFIDEGRGDNPEPRNVVIVGHRAALRMLVAILMAGYPYRGREGAEWKVDFAECLGFDNMSLTHIAIRHVEGGTGGGMGYTPDMGYTTLRSLNVTAPEGTTYR